VFEYVFDVLMNSYSVGLRASVLFLEVIVVVVGANGGGVRVGATELV
jgi:hypothetical protein